MYISGVPGTGYLIRKVLISKTCCLFSNSAELILIRADKYINVVLLYLSVQLPN